MNIEIEKNLPVPPRSRRPKYPLGEMKVNDSIFIYGSEAGAKARGAAHTYGRTNNLAFVTRTQDGGVRIWRTE